MTPYIIANKILNQIQGLDRERIINNKIIIDLTNRTIIVEGHDYTYSPTGAIIITEPFKYEVDNTPLFPAIAEVVEVKDTDGTILIPATEGVAEIPANNRFDNIATSPLGLAIAGMVQNTLNQML